MFIFSHLFCTVHGMALKYENVISRTLEILFKWHRSQNNSATLLIMCHIFVFQEILTPLDLLTWVCFLFVCFVYFSFNVKKVEIVIEKQIQKHLNFIDPKIKSFMISGVLFGALYPKMKTRKSRKFIKNIKILKYENAISSPLEIFFKWHPSWNNSTTLLTICHIFLFQEILTPLHLLTWVCFFLFCFVLFISVLTLKKK